MSDRLLARPVGASRLSPSSARSCDALMTEGALVWLDVVTEDVAELDDLGERFGFDPAAIEDIIDIEQLPKYDDYGDYLFVVLHALTTSGDRLDTVEVDCFVGRRLLVTVSSEPVAGVSWLWETVQTHGTMGDEGAGELFAHLSEVIGRGYLEVINEFEARVDDLGDRALSADPEILGVVQLLRREEATVRKVLRPQRLVMADLRRDPTNLLGEEARAQLLDAFDVHNQVVESLAAARGLVTDTLDSYRGAAADRQAAATTVLAVYSAIMLPLTFLTGWYGMNLRHLPGDSLGWGWAVLLVVMVAIALVSFAAFVRAGFIHPPGWRNRATLRGLAGAARAPVDAASMLRRPRR